MKKILSSKQRTFLRAALLALFLLVVFTIPLYAPFSAQVVRMNEIHHSTEPTEIIQKGYEDPWTFYLSANENTLMLTVCGFHPFVGWGLAGWHVLDLTQEWGPVQAGGTIMNYQNTRASIHVFGMTTLPNAVSAAAFSKADPTIPTLEMDILRSEGEHSYFYGCRTEEPLLDFSSERIYTHLSFLDRTGTVLYTYDMTNQWSNWSGG